MKYFPKIGFILCIVLPVVMIVSGCSTVSYVEPKTGPVARVRFATDTPHITTIYEYSSKNCDGEKEMMRLRRGFLFNSDPRRLGMPLWTHHHNSAKEFFVTPDEPHLYMIKSENIYSTYPRLTKISCAVVISQEFENSKDYEIEYKWNKSRCYANIYKINKKENGEPEKFLLKKISNQLNDGFSKTCLKVFKSTKLW